MAKHTFYVLTVKFKFVSKERADAWRRYYPWNEFAEGMQVLDGSEVVRNCPEEDPTE